MHLRQELHYILTGVLGTDAVYFQPPTGTIMVYPCIVYQLSDVDTKFADNLLYSAQKEYLVTVMDKDPDTLIPEKILALPRCSFDRHYTKDNLNHYVLRLYF